MDTNVLEHAKLIDVPVFRAGTHNGLVFTEHELDGMIDAANVNRDYLKESMLKGMYEGNDFQLDKPIPGFINLGHQKFLKDTIKEATRDVNVSFKKKVVDGVNWIVATFEGVKDDVAEFLAGVFPLRSVEIIPELYNPTLGQRFKNVIRSVGFLDRNTMPAVSGQAPKFLMEFTQHPAILLFSEDDSYFETLTQPEDNTMADVKKQDAPVKDDTITLQEYEKLQKDRDALVKEMAAKLDKADKEKEEMLARLKLVEMAKEQADVEGYLERMKGKNASPAFIEAIGPVISQINGSHPIEFAADDKRPARQKVQEVFETVLEMAKKGALFIPVGEFAAQAHKDPTQEKELDRGTQQRMAIAEFQEAAKNEAKDPKDEREVFGIALQKATRKYGDKLFG